MNIPTKDNVSNEAVVQVMLENDTCHYDTDHDDIILVTMFGPMQPAAAYDAPRCLR